MHLLVYVVKRHHNLLYNAVEACNVCKEYEDTKKVITYQINFIFIHTIPS